jgi:hypothetical protein
MQANTPGSIYPWFAKGPDPRIKITASGRRGRSRRAISGRKGYLILIFSINQKSYLDNITRLLLG